MTKIEGLDENLSPHPNDWIPIQPPGQKLKKIRLGNIAADTSDLANTVSVLEQQVGSKSPIGHGHQISDVNGLLEKLSFQWSRKNSDSELIYKTLVDTSDGDITLSVPASLVVNQEFEIKKIFSNNYCKVTGISKINGYSLQQGDLLFFDDSATSASTTKLIYIDSTVGWLSFPPSAFSLVKPLSIPTDKLKQLFYSGNVFGLSDNQTLQTWLDPVSGLNATQAGDGLKPNFQNSIFGNASLPGIKFSGNQFFDINCNWLLNKYFTVCIVEQRTAQTPNMTIIGERDYTFPQFTLQYDGSTGASFGVFTGTAQQLFYSTGNYTNPITRMWIFSNNSREWALWLNGQKMLTRNTQNVTNIASIKIGRSFYDNSFYKGYLGLLAFYEGDMSDAEIKTISDAANQTFKVY